MFMTKRKKEKLAQQEKQRLNEQREKEFRERTLINKTLRELQRNIEKYENQKQLFIKMAREAEKRNLTSQYKMAANGLKIVIEAQDKANAMYLNLTIADQIKQFGTNTTNFVASMNTLSKQLAAINQNLDFVQVENDYNTAMQEVSDMEEKLRSFSDTIQDSVESYASLGQDDGKVDKAIEMMIHSTPSDDEIQSATDSVNQSIDLKIKDIDRLIKNGN